MARNPSSGKRTQTGKRRVTKTGKKAGNKKSGRSTALMPVKKKPVVKLSPQIEKLKTSLQNVRGTSKAEMHRVFNPIGLAMTEYSLAYKKMMRTVQRLSAYLQNQLNEMVAADYDLAEIKMISDIVENGKKAFEEFGLPGVEAYVINLDEAADRLNDLLEAGPEAPHG